MKKRRRLRARDRRAIVLGLIAITPFALYRTAVGPWLAYRDGLSSALVAERDLLQREREAIVRATQLPSQMTTMERAIDDAEGWLLAASSDVAASGQLTRRVSELGLDAAVLVQDVRAAPAPEATGGVLGAAVQVRVLGDLEGIARFLHGLENSGRLIHVTDFVVQPAGVNDGDLERGQLLTAAFVATAFWRGGSP